MTGPRVGVLALQGDVREHMRVLTKLGADVTLVRRAEELESVQGLVLPGGESSVIDKLARSFGLSTPLREAIGRGLPVYGTCAGLILLADRIENPIEGQQSFGGLDVTVRRNAFGGQRESCEMELAVAGWEAPTPAAFIRAPLVVGVGPGVQVRAEIPGRGIVAVSQGNLLGTAFHPEVAGDLRFHELFLDLVRAA